MRALAVIQAVAVVSALASCSAVLGIESDRSYVPPEASTPAPTPSDAGEGGVDAGPDPWACLTMSKPAPTGTVSLTLIVMDGLQNETSAGSVDGGSDLDTVSGAYLPGISVRPCAQLDPGCLSAPAPQSTDDAGRVTFDLQGGFSGFFSMNGALNGSPGVPVSLYPGKVLDADDKTSIPAYEISRDGLQLLTSTIVNTPPSLDPDGGLGHVLVNIYDCNDHQAPDVSIRYATTSAQTTPFFFKNGIPNADATKTDGYGLGGAINIPAGAQTVSASRADGGLIGMVPITVRAGEITWAWIRAKAL